MCAHLGDLRRSWSTWAEIFEDLRARGSQKAEERAKGEIFAVKRGREVSGVGVGNQGRGDTPLVPN